MQHNKVIVYGSLNIDVIYKVPHIVIEGETIASLAQETNVGGKGANQCVALAKAGVDVSLAGKIGEDGRFILSALESYGVDISHVIVSNDIGTGRAIIQVDQKGMNSIILYPGTNSSIEKSEIDDVLSAFGKDDYIILQNEINNLDYIIDKAVEKGMRVCINPSPISDEILKLDYKKMNTIFVNEIEAMALAGVDKDLSYDDIATVLGGKYPEVDIILTCGKSGAYWIRGSRIIHQDIIDYPVVDTTAAGDTFMGYYLASKVNGRSVEECLYYASVASGIAVSRSGASKSIPFRDEVFE